MTNPKESAFPRALPTGYIKANDVDAAFWESQARGMSKREYFAGLAMKALWDTVPNDQSVLVKPDNLAKTAIRMADALIAELNKEVKS